MPELPVKGACTSDALHGIRCCSAMRRCTAGTRGSKAPLQVRHVDCMVHNFGCFADMRCGLLTQFVREFPAFSAR